MPGLLGDEAAAADERLSAGGLLSRLTSMATAWGTPAGLRIEDLLPDEERRRAAETEVRRFAATGSGVILGRAAAAVLRADPRALHVLLDGPVDARIAQAMRIEGVDRDEAKRRLGRMDGYRRAYLECLYGVDAREPGLFHLVLDTTAIPLEHGVQVIAEAARRHAR